MKRFTLLLTLTLVDLPWGTTLAFQSPDSVSRDSSNHAIAFGYFATLGASWQIEAVEIGYVRHPNRGPAGWPSPVAWGRSWKRVRS
jgi:hypothetical protein